MAASRSEGSARRTLRTAKGRTAQHRSGCPPPVTVATSDRAIMPDIRRPAAMSPLPHSCRSRRVSSQLAPSRSGLRAPPRGYEPTDSNRPTHPGRVSATISTPAEASMTTAVTLERRRATSVAPRPRRDSRVRAPGRREGRQEGHGRLRANSPPWGFVTTTAEPGGRSLGRFAMR